MNKLASTRALRLVPKHPKKSILMGLLALAFTHTSCASKVPQSQVKRSAIPSTQELLSLGQAYDTDTAKWTNLNCVTGEIDLTSAGSQTGDARTVYERDLSYEEVLDKLGGRLSVGVQFPSVAVDAKASYAAENSTNEFRETHTLSFRTQRKSKFKLGSVRISDTGRKLSGTSSLRAQCGNEFINEINIGLSYMATLSVEFSDQASREKFGGSLKVDVLRGTVEVEGNLEKADDSVKKSVKISLQATQIGGDERKLSTVISTGLTECNALNLAPCIAAFKKAIEYGNTIAEQLTDDSKYAVIGYTTESYADTGITELVAQNHTLVTQLVEDKRLELEAQLKATRINYARMQSILNFAELLNREKRQKVSEQKDALEVNKENLSRALLYCYRLPYSKVTAEGSETFPCVDNAKRVVASLLPFDESLVQIAVPEEDKDRAKCKVALALAKKKGVISERQFKIYTDINFAPEYSIPNNPDSEIIGWGECKTLAPYL